jgi:flagellar hook assembly protein FlgD
MEPVIPTVFALGQNVPNPFNPQTLIVYDIPVAVTSVSLDIYDVAGRHVRNLVRGPVAPGRLNARWNGEDDRGRPVASGVYYYRLDAGSFRATKRALLLR